MSGVGILTVRILQNFWILNEHYALTYSHHYTDKNIIDKSYKLVKHFQDFPLWE